MERILHRRQATYDPGFHIQMLLDTERVRAYEIAISKLVKPGDVVVDAGTGSGVLALLAARAGAGRVYALEIDEEIAAVARRNFQDSPYTDSITLIMADACEADLPESTDVVIGELLHAWLLEEAQLPAVLNLRRFLRPRGRLIPSVVANTATLVQVRLPQPGCPVLSAFHLWRGDMHRPRALSDPVLVDTVDLAAIDNLEADVSAEFLVRRHGEANAIAIDSSALLTASQWLGETQTLFPTVYLPLAKPHAAPVGGKLAVRFRFRYGCRLPSVAVEVTTRTVSRNNPARLGRHS